MSELYSHFKKKPFLKGIFSLQRWEIAAYTYLLYSFPLTVLNFIWALSSQEAATVKNQSRGPLLSCPKKRWSTKGHPTLAEPPHDPDKTHLLLPFLGTLCCQLQIVPFHGHLPSIPLQGLSRVLRQLLIFNTFWRSSGWRAEKWGPFFLLQENQWDRSSDHLISQELILWAQFLYLL